MSKPVTAEERRLKATLRQIARLIDEADLGEPTPLLVAVPEPIAVSLEQASVLLGVSTTTLYEYVRSRQLRVLCMGRRRLILLDTLRTFAKDRETDDPPP